MSKEVFKKKAWMTGGFAALALLGWSELNQEVRADSAVCYAVEDVQAREECYQDKQNFADVVSLLGLGVLGTTAFLGVRTYREALVEENEPRAVVE